MRLWAAIIIALMLSGCSSDGPPSREENPPASQALPDIYVFRQNDPAWKNIRLGGSGEPLGSHGCLITGVAMSLANLGFDTDPGNLTETLIAHEGFTSRGWIVWKAVEDATAGEAKVSFYREPNPAHVRQCLARGDYPLVKFTLPNGMPHWLVVYEERADDFYVRDPYDVTDKPFPMTRRTPTIEAVRCVGVRD